VDLAAPAEYNGVTYEAGTGPTGSSDDTGAGSRLAPDNQYGRSEASSLRGPSAERGAFRCGELQATPTARS